MNGPYIVYKAVLLATEEYFYGVHSRPLGPTPTESDCISLRQISSHPTKAEAAAALSDAIGLLWQIDEKCLNRGPLGQKLRALPKLPSPPKPTPAPRRRTENMKRWFGPWNERPPEIREKQLEARKKMLAAAQSPRAKTKRALAQSRLRTGVPRPDLRKYYSIEGKIYHGIQQVISEYGLTKQSVINRVRSEKFPDWFKVDASAAINTTNEIPN